MYKCAAHTAEVNAAAGRCRSIELARRCISEIIVYGANNSKIHCFFHARFTVQLSGDRNLLKAEEELKRERTMSGT